MINSSLFKSTFVVLALAVGAASCSSKPTKAPPKEAVKAGGKKGQATKGKEARAKVGSPAPGTPNSASARTPFDQQMQAAQKFHASKDFSRAHAGYLKARELASNPTQEKDSLVGGLRSAVEGGLTDEQAQLLPLAMEKIPATDEARTEVASLYLTDLLNQERKLPFLTALQMESAQGNQIVLNVWNDRALEVIRTGLNEEEKTILMTGNYPAQWKSVIQAQKATQEIQQVLTEEAPEEEAVPVDARTIGVVLPLTGKNSTVARKTLRGLQLGLGLSSKDPSGFRLVIGDSEGRPERSKKVTEKLIKKDGAIAIVGSLLSKNAQSVAAAASALGTPTVSLSQRPGITQISPLVFRNTLTAEIQVKALVKVAMKDLNLTRFAVIYPNDTYGVEMANLFWDEVLARGGSVVAAQTYAPEETDFKKTIEKMVGLEDPEARIEEYRLRVKERKALKKETSVRNQAEDVLPPITQFEAVFIPDSVKALGQISAMLAFAGVRNVHLMGPNLWNHPQLGRRVNQSFNPLLFVDFQSSLGEKEDTDFVRSYRQQFGEEPGTFELQAYDTALMLRSAISEGAQDRAGLAKALSEVKTFPGGRGPLAQFPTREFHRPLVAWTLAKGQISPYLLAE